MKLVCIFCMWLNVHIHFWFCWNPDGSGRNFGSHKLCIYICVGIMPSINHTMETRSLFNVHAPVLIDCCVTETETANSVKNSACFDVCFRLPSNKREREANGSRKIQAENISKLMSILLFKSIHIPCIRKSQSNLSLYVEPT